MVTSTYERLTLANMVDTIKSPGKGWHLLKCMPIPSLTPLFDRMRELIFATLTESVSTQAHALHNIILHVLSFFAIRADLCVNVLEY
jgi:hypothetical protein